MTGAMSEQDASSRRLAWIVRLAIYPLAIALIALVWHQRHAEAGTGTGATAAVPVLSYLTGTVGDAPATARLMDQRRPRLAFLLPYRCTPNVGAVEVTHWNLPVDGGDRPHVRARDIAITWATGWRGLASVDLDGRRDADGRMRATVSGRMALDANGVRADCVADPVALALDPAGAGPRGLTTQGEPVQVTLGGDGAPAALSVSLRLWCADRTVRHMVWTTALDAHGSAARDWGVIGPDYELLVGRGDDGRLVAQVDRADGQVRGVVEVAATLPGSGLSCRPRTRSVAFALGGS
jgi:hypothetical protein